MSGHTFVLWDRRGRNPYCERCRGVIWRLVQAWYRCKCNIPSPSCARSRASWPHVEACGYRSHAKCLDLVRRTCAGVLAKRRPGYLLSICPEKGLAAQKYRCAECRSKWDIHPSRTFLSSPPFWRLAFEGEAAEEPRLCDYTGLFFCPSCHWQDEVPSKSTPTSQRKQVQFPRSSYPPASCTTGTLGRDPSPGRASSSCPCSSPNPSSIWTPSTPASSATYKSFANSRFTTRIRRGFHRHQAGHGNERQSRGPIKRTAVEMRWEEEDQPQPTQKDSMSDLRK